MYRIIIQKGATFFIPLFTLLLFSLPTSSWAFCGFYVAKADTGLFNKSSQVAIVRDKDRNIITMGSDFKGDAKEFAMVVPVPSILAKTAIKVVNPKILDHLDAYTAPRLVEYFDKNPCRVRLSERMASMRPMAAPMIKRKVVRREQLGVTIEAQYKVEEYDILILSAKESTGLITWLTENGYKMPKGAKAVVGSYLKQGMRFFVAKVNLKKYNKKGYTKLRPLQINYRHARFMLPIRLGTLNAQGKQELFIYAMTRKGRVETTNYRTIKLPSDLEIPPYIKTKKQFPNFYRSLFRTLANKEKKAVVIEYAWDMNWCDPCAANPLSDKELRDIGVYWIKPANPKEYWKRNAKDVFITRLHVSYDSKSFPSDLVFQVTSNRENYQGRYVVRHPWKGTASCNAAKKYYQQILPDRQAKEAETLARITGWDINKIRRQIPQINPTP
ncbi:MAG: DUF2330 domain-containing protein [Cocleimonas sp.]|nr:DUF2330 domain-containing protein [Cocleimonas sp.]